MTATEQANEKREELARLETKLAETEAEVETARTALREAEEAATAAARSGQAVGDLETPRVALRTAESDLAVYRQAVETATGELSELEHAARDELQAEKLVEYRQAVRALDQKLEEAKAVSERVRALHAALPFPGRQEPWAWNEFAPGGRLDWWRRQAKALLEGE